MSVPADFASPAPGTTVPHICVCVCTYKRPQMLMRLLEKLERQETGEWFTYSVVVTDNDEERSGEAAVMEMRARLAIPIEYDLEPRRNIALARNKAVANAHGEYLALIDDDEFPAPDWLLTLFRTCNEHGVDGVLGPVIRHFDQTPPGWLLRSRFYDRRVNPTGTAVSWQEARTGNVLLKARVISGEPPFRAEFRAGEDQDFFRRKIEAGFVFIWSADARVFETIPPARWKRSYLLRKAALQGATAALQPSCNAVSIAKSMVAVPLYAAGLPFALLCGQHRFMTLLEKLFQHAGKLLALIGIDPVPEEYVSDENGRGERSSTHECDPGNGSRPGQPRPAAGQAQSAVRGM